MSMGATDNLIVIGDAMATAHNIVGQERWLSYLKAWCRFASAARRPSCQRDGTWSFRFMEPIKNEELENARRNRLLPTVHGVVFATLRRHVPPELRLHQRQQHDADDQDHEASRRRGGE